MDTCAVSDATKPHPDAGLAGWLKSVEPAHVYISVITLGEIRKGIECCSESAKKAALEAWLTNAVAQEFAGRVLSFDAEVADRWGRLVGALHQGGITAGAIDSLIAATALEHNLSVVTRNEKNFKPMGISITNPWSGASLA
jgi:predicted nucleic acid-binding protein